MSRPTKAPRELHVQAPELMPQLDLVAKYIGETRSVATREVIRRGIAGLLEDVGFKDIDELKIHLENKA